MKGNISPLNLFIDHVMNFATYVNQQIEIKLQPKLN